MIERVARKLCEKFGDDPDGTEERALKSGIWTDAGQLHWTGYVEIACATIADMREPTEEMIRAGVSAEFDEMAAQVWREMIDEALKDGA